MDAIDIDAAAAATATADIDAAADIDDADFFTAADIDLPQANLLPVADL
jgi:hypothetical protein